jgi:sugar/nucleoside kinase (ribokinase family)
MIDITGVGANSIDRVLRIPVDIHSLASSGKVRVTSQQWSSGGQTATAMSACAALGLRARYIGAFGSDDHGRRVRAELAGRGVDVHLSDDSDGPNPGAVIIVDATGCRTVLWDCDERVRVVPEQISMEILKDSRLIHVDDVDAAASLHVCAAAAALGTPVTSDIEQATDTTESLIRAVTFPIFDHNAPALLTGESDPERALRKLRRLSGGLLCMTLGDHGAAALEGDAFHLVPALSVTQIDTTGAGDVFRAGFIYGLLQRWRVPEVLRFANAAAAISCTREGAIASVPSLEDVEQLLGGGSHRSSTP